MDNAWQRYLETATEITAITRRRAESVVRSLVKQGEVAADRAERSVEELLARSERNRRAISDLVAKEVERSIGRLRLVRREEFDRLAGRVARLEAGGTTTAQAAKKTTTKKKKAAAKKAAAKKAAAKKAAPAAKEAAPTQKETAKKSAGGTR